MKRTPLPRQKTPLKRYTRIPPVSPKRRQRSGRVGKTGIVRLYGRALKQLRRQRFEMDKFTCVDCGLTVAWDRNEAIEVGLPVGELSHVRNKRMHGDTIENTRTRCQDCHRKSHNCGGKPLPRKNP